MPHPGHHHGHYRPDRRFYRPEFHYPSPNDDDTSMEDITTMLLVATVAIIALRK